MKKKAGCREGWFRAGIARLVIVLLVLGGPALGPRMARADTHTSTGTLPGESDCQYQFDADTSALTFSGAVTCSGKDYGFQVNGKLKGLAITVTDFTVTIAGQDVKIGINKTYQVPFDTKNVSKLDDDFQKVVTVLNSDILQQVPGLGTVLKDVGFGGKDGSATGGFQKAVADYDKSCAQTGDTEKRCQFSDDPGPTETGSDQASGSGSADSGDSSNSQEEVCPGLQKIKGYLIVCIPSYLKGKLSLGSDVLLITPGGALMSLPLGASLSHPFMPVISTSGSVLLTAGGIFGAGLEIDAKGGVGVAGGLIAVIGPLIVKGYSLLVGKLDLSQVSGIPSMLGLDVPGSAGLPGLVFADSLSAQVKNFTVASHSRLSVNGGGGAGGSPTFDQGVSPEGASNNWGGSYGGLGGDPGVSGYDNPGSPGSIQGDPFHPTSGGYGAGGDNNTATGSPGGGSIVISATDTLKVDGVLTANGDDGAADPENATATGSGGSMLLTAGTVAGGGTISADGGSRAGDAGAAGGGGRIAIYYAHKSFSGQVHAYGGRQTDISHYAIYAPANSGGAGTVFWQGSSEPKHGGTLIVSGDSATLWPPPGETPIKADWSSPDRTLVVENGARAEVLSAAYQTITVQHGGVITLPLTRPVDGRNGGIVLSPATQTMTLSATTILVDPTSRIDVSAHGDAGGDNSGTAAGNGKTPGTRGAGEGPGSWGGSHGGIGGNVPGSDATSWDGTVPSDKLGGTAYDDPTNPLQVGGGSGGSSDGTSPGASGGGVLRLTASTLHLDGRLVANGQPNLLPTPDFPTINAGLAGGGAGGSLNLQVHTLTGGGSIEADGGNTCVLIADLLSPSVQAGCGEDGSEGAGGGGRIAIRYTDTKGWTGKVHAYGGYNVSYLHEHHQAIQVGRAGPGTVFWLAAGQPADGGKLVIAGGGLTTDRRAGTPLGAKVNGAHRTLIITGGAVAYGKNLKVANLELL
ncbi:MAG: hypothetical protein ACRDIE_04100, partial [Chloroflexota bacterium]